MAERAQSSAATVRPWRSAFGSPQLRTYQESTCAATAVIRVGDIVGIDTVVSTGGFRVVRAEVGGGEGTDLLNTTNVLGVAVSPSTSDGSPTGLGADGLSLNRGRDITVAIADGVTEFLGQLSTATTTLKPAMSSLIGLRRAVRYISGRYFIDSTNSTAALASVLITDVPDSELGTTGGLVAFKFLSSQTHPSVRLNVL